MDIEQFYIDYSVDYLTEGHKHCKHGWVNTPCPFCTGNEGYHLGYNIEQGYFKCWRCGFHHENKVVAYFTNSTQSQAKTIIREYGGNVKVEKKTVIKKRLKLPTGTTEMKDRHKAYLRKRNFDPDILADEWGLLGTSPTSNLDGAKYFNRVLIPIMWDGHMVSFQGRSISKDSKMKYKACPQNRELMEHQKILYGDNRKWSDTIIVMEGVADVWRFGAEYACATFGIEFSTAQIRILAKNFKKVYVMFDNDPQAITQGAKIVNELRFRGVSAEQIILDNGDPADMTDVEAQDWISKLF